MSKYLAYYNLSSISDAKDFLGTARDCQEGNVIATLCKNIVVVINIRTQAPVHSWSTLEKLSTKVVYDPLDESYVGVFAQRALRRWKSTTSDVNKCKKLRFQRAIADLVCVDNEIYVLYKNGTCQLLAQAIETRNEQEDEPLEQTAQNICDASITRFPDKRKLLTYFVNDPDTKQLQLMRVPLYGNGEPTRFTVQRDSLNVQLMGYAVVEGNVAPFLWTVWSDRRIFVMSLDDNIEPEISPGYFVDMMNTLKMDKPLAVVGVSKNILAMYGPNRSQEGASLLLYNTQYKVANAKQFFKVHLESTRLWAAKGYIFLAMGQSFSVATYQVDDQLLSELIGVQSGHKYDTPIPLDNIDEDELLLENLREKDDDLEEIITPKPYVDPFDEEIKDLKHADGKEVPFEDIEDFDRTLRKLLKQYLQVDLVETDDPTEANVIELMSNAHDNGFDSRHIRYLAMAMEQCGAGEQEITEKLMTVLIAVDELAEVANCLRRYNNISEKLMAKTLSYLVQKLPVAAPQIEEALAAKENVETNFVKPSKTEVPVMNLLSHIVVAKPASELLPADVLDLLLGCSFDDSQLSTCLRLELELPAVVRLLQYLYDSLASVTKLAFEERPTEMVEHVRFELQHFRWFGVLINSHFQKLVLCKNEALVAVLLKWHDIFELYQRDMQELEEAASIFRKFLHCHRMQQNNMQGKWYAIEEVCLF